MINDWLDQARKYQARLKTDSRAQAPEPINLIYNKLFPEPIYIMGIKQNIRDLEQYKKGASPQNKTKIDNIIKLYTDRILKTSKLPSTLLSDCKIQQPEKIRLKRLIKNINK